MKSILLINGNDPKALLNSTLYGADAVAYDLHEAVGTADKDARAPAVAGSPGLFRFRGQRRLCARESPVRRRHGRHCRGG